MQTADVITHNSGDIVKIKEMPSRQKILNEEKFKNNFVKNF